MKATPQPDRHPPATAAERRRTRSACFAVVDRMPIPTKSLARARSIVRRADASLQRPRPQRGRPRLQGFERTARPCANGFAARIYGLAIKSSGGSTNSRRRSPDSSARWNERPPGSTADCGHFAGVGRQRCWSVTGTTFVSRSARVTATPPKAMRDMPSRAVSLEAKVVAGTAFTRVLAGRDHDPEPAHLVGLRDVGRRRPQLP